MLEFIEEWRRLDPTSSHYISANYLPLLLQRLLAPLGFGTRVSPTKHMRRIRRAWLPIRGDDMVHFSEVSCRIELMPLQSLIQFF